MAWLAAGFNPNKLAVGIPFYGYVYSGVSPTGNGLYQRFSSAKAVGYDSLVSNYLSNSLFAHFFSASADVSWLYGNSTFISCEDAGSVTQKAMYAAGKGLRGASVWELDYGKTGLF
jgi:chitinase